MALQPYPGFVGPSYTSESKIAAYDRLVNWYPEQIESGTGTARYVLYPTPGYQVVASGLSSPGRGALTINGAATGGSFQGHAYFVSGGSVYQWPSTLLSGGISNGADHPITMVTNGDAGHQILIASDSTTYNLDLNTHVLTNVGTGFSVGFLDTYGIRLNIITNEISISAQEDFSTWDPLDVAQREDAPDPWQFLLVFHKELWLFGSETTSVYYNAFSGNSAPTDFPFQPIPSAFMNVGMLSRYSACVAGNAPMWLGQGADGAGVVYRANGYTPVRVSTHAIENELRQMPTISVAEGSTYQENGHIFYELTCPTLADGALPGRTFVYDITSGFWHERGVRTGLDFVELDTRTHFQLGGQQYTLGRTTGTVYTQSLDLSVGTDGTTGITRLRRAPHLVESLNRIRYSHLRLLMETGLGKATGQGSDPLMAIRWSDNGGQTWGATRTLSVGKIGEYGVMPELWQLGQARDRIFEFTVSDPIPYRLMDAFVDFSVGR